MWLLFEFYLSTDIDNIKKREFRFDSTGGPNLVTPQSAIDTWTDEVRALL